MSDTKPSGLPLISSPDALVLQEPAEIDDRARFNILPRWRTRYPWLSGARQTHIDVLVVLDKPGLASLQDYALAEPIRRRYAEIEASDHPDRLLLLRRIQDRYVQWTFTPKERVHVGDPFLLHLGLPIGRVEKFSIYVALFPDRIDLMSIGYRNAQAMERIGDLSDLP